MLSDQFYQNLAFQNSLILQNIQKFQIQEMLNLNALRSPQIVQFQNPNNPFLLNRSHIMRNLIYNQQIQQVQYLDYYKISQNIFSQNYIGDF